MYPKSTSSIALWSTKVSSSIKQPDSKLPQSRKAVSNSELVSDLPDLSHLSEEERTIIQSVLDRQKAEEEKDLKLTRLSTKSNTNQNFSSIASSNNSLSNVDHLKLKKSQRHSISDIAQEIKQRYGSVDTGNVCDICKKIKFTNSSVGRVCFSCKSRCCIRCSVKYITKSKEIWMCSVCKRKQDEFVRSALSSRKKIVTEVAEKIETGHVNQTSSKRRLPNLSRIKQLSQDESSSRQEHLLLNTTKNSEDLAVSARKQGRLRMSLIKQASLTNPPNYFKELNEPVFLQNNTSNKHASSQELNKNSLTNETNFYSSPGSSVSQMNLGRSRAERIGEPALLLKASRNSSRKNSSSNLSELAQMDIDETSMYLREKSMNALLKEKHSDVKLQPSDKSINAVKSSQLEERINLAENIFEDIQTKLDDLDVSGKSSGQVKVRKQPALPVLPVDTSVIKNKLLAELKQRSLNLSDDENQSDDIELVDIESNALNNRNEDIDGNDDEEDENEDYDLDEELRSTTEYTTNDEMEFESASLTAKKLVDKKSNRNSVIDELRPIVENYLIKDLPKEEILAHKINKFLSPSDWKLSADGKKMLGHVVLKKSMINTTNSVVNSSSNSTIDSATDFNLSLSFGMKVIGGRPDPITHQLSAYIVKLKKDSIADTIGRLQVNDEIVKWNGKLLRGLSFDEVYSIINKSKQDAQIDLVVERRLKSSNALNLQEAESNICPKNAESNLAKTNNQKIFEKIKSIGKIQLKLFHDSIENKLYVNILTLLINQQQINLEFIYCKIQIFTSLKKEIYSKTSDRYNFEKETHLVQISEAFTFEPVDQTLVNELTIHIEIINYQTQQTIGKSEFLITPEMFENRLVNLDIIPCMDQIHSKPTPGVSVESLNSGSLNSRRRQLPQIPVNKITETNDKAAIDQNERNRMLKTLKQLEKNDSVSDSESSILNMKKSAKSNKQEIREMSNLPFKRVRDHKSNIDEEMVHSAEGIGEFESLAGLNGPNIHEQNPNKYPNQRRVTCANSDEIKSRLMPKKNIQPYSLENLPNDYMWPLREKPNNQRMSPTSGFKIDAWPEYENLQKPHAKASSNPIIDSEENSLYLNKGHPIQSTNLANSSSQTFFSPMNKPIGNSNGAKPERLFSSRLLNQRTQNAVLHSTKADSQSQAKIGEYLESNGTEKQNFKEQQDSKMANESKEMPNAETIPSSNKDSALIGTGIKNQTNEKRNSDKNDGTMSDSALTNPMSNFPETANKKRRPSMAKALVILGLSKKSNSASNLTSNKRFGFARSEEYGMLPELRNRNLSPSSAEVSVDDKKPRLWSGALKLPHEKPFNEFIENLGPGQKVSRQVLGLPCLGEIKLEMSIKNQRLTIQICEVKKLKPKIGHRILPNVYIKFYLYNGVSCNEKQKTSIQRRTLNPVYNETLRFESDYKNKILQLTVWGDYGKLDKKVFMGIVQIVLDDCRLNEGVNGWYKLYPASSIINDFSSFASADNFSQAESGYSISSSQKMVK